MTTVIVDETTILKLQRKFHKRLSEYSTERINCRVGYPSGSFEDTVKYSPSLNIWISVREHSSRYWNGFGIGKPVEARNNSLVGEINFPYSDIDRRISGVFAIEENGNILVLHRGKLGGGKLGVGKKLFRDNFRGDLITANDGGKESIFFLVGELDSQYFPQQVSIFINEINRIKKINESPARRRFEYLNKFQFAEESSGTSNKRTTGMRTTTRTHGIVVNKLAIDLIDKGFSVGNDNNRDLFIYNKNRIKALFEIKTTSSSQSLFAAVGQLIVYSIPIKNPVGLIIVLPHKLKKIVLQRLALNNIKVLYYEWRHGMPIFAELDGLLDVL